MIKLAKIVHINPKEIIDLIKDRDSNYLVYKIRKNNKSRIIEEPKEFLKHIQKQLVTVFEQFKLSSHCTGCLGKGVPSNAAPHAGAKYILKIDIKQCYPSITKEKILSVIKGHELEEIFTIALPLCLFSRRREEILPTGAPTSPILCNIALTPIDLAISELVGPMNYSYTRYIDDIHISTKESKRDWSILNSVKKILSAHGYRINREKTKWQTRNTADKIIVTGVGVGINKVPRDFRRMLRAKLQNLAKDKQPINAETRGCLAFVKSVDEDKYYQLMDYYERRLQYGAQE